MCGLLSVVLVLCVVLRVRTVASMRVLGLGARGERERLSSS